MRAERVLGFALALALFASGARAADPPIEDVTIRLATPEATYALAASVQHPPNGVGRHPAIVLNHGAWGPAPRRREVPRVLMQPASAWFAERGFLVVSPMRRGYGASEGEVAEASGPCDDSDYLRAARVSAEDILAAVAWTRARGDVDPARIVVVGYSAGGWAALGAAAAAPAGVVAVINVSGGRGGFPQNGVPCRPDRMLAAAETLARTAPMPTLWIYVEGDALFGAMFSPGLARAWRAGGGQVEFHLLPRLPVDGHGMFLDPEGLPYWSPFVADFLARVVR